MNKVAAFLLGLSTAGQADPAPDAATLTRLVQHDCGSCHGMTLKGGLGPDIRPAALGQYNHETLSAVILDGIPGTAMPPWRPLLTEAEVDWVADYLLTGGE